MLVKFLDVADRPASGISTEKLSFWFHPKAARYQRILPLGLCVWEGVWPSSHTLRACRWGDDLSLRILNGISSYDIHMCLAARLGLCKSVAGPGALFAAGIVTSRVLLNSTVIRLSTITDNTPRLTARLRRAPQQSSAAKTVLTWYWVFYISRN